MPLWCSAAARAAALALCGFLTCTAALADGTLHSLWQIRGRHNTVYLLGSIHILRPSDYPLPAVVIEAYNRAQSLYMEVNLGDLDSAQVQTELLSSAIMPESQNLPAVLGRQRYEHAYALARDAGVELATYDQFAPWFAAEAVSQAQLTQLGFQTQSGVEMYFLERARTDGKNVAGLETLRDQIGVFKNMPLAAQAEYLLSSLEEAHDMPRNVDAMVNAWQHGDTGWFARELRTELRPQMYQSFLVTRNRKWIPKIEALLNDDKDCLVIVGTGHLVGPGSVLELLKKDGITATQR
jgi:uncharacterized protein